MLEPTSFLLYEHLDIRSSFMPSMMEDTTIILYNFFLK